MTRAVVVLAVAVMAAAREPPYAHDPAAVHAGRWLQAAIDRAQPGDTVTLRAGATYVGHFWLPGRATADAVPPIVITTEGEPAVPPGTRLSPADAIRLAKLQSPDGQPVLRTAAGARGWRLELIEFLPTRNGRGEIVALGDPRERRRSRVPSDIVLDRIYIHGDPRTGQKRGIALNSYRTSITNSYIGDIKTSALDSQAIAGWNGPGEYLIANNYLEAAGENVLFGGGDPSIAGLVPSSIVIKGNTLSKPIGWLHAPRPWLVKNLLELKNAQRVVIQDNLFERNWVHGQSGYAVLFTVRNQDGGCPWCEVRDIRFERNIVRDVPAGISILGTDDIHSSSRTTGVLIRDNLFHRLGGEPWGGDGFAVQLIASPRDIVIDGNTIQPGAGGGLVKIEGAVEGFVFTNNLTGHGAYGIIARDRGPGNDSIRASLPGAIVAGNVIAGANPAVYPPENLFPPTGELSGTLRTAP